MWISLVFLAIVGLVAGEATPWKPNQEYSYNIYARTLTALPDLKNQYVGVVTKGKLILHPKANGHIVGKLTKIAHAHFHDDLVGGWDSEIPEQVLSFQESTLNNKAFTMQMKNGVVQSVSVDQSMTNDEVNQLKAILSQLQIDITGENLVKCRHNQLPERNDKLNALYKTMEATVTGECETLYDIEHLPEYIAQQTYPDWAPRMDIAYEGAKGNFFQVVKTMNFNNCKLRKGYHFGLTGESDFKPNTNQMGDFLSKSSMTNIVASGQANDFTIHQVYTTNRVAVSPAMYHEQKAQVISQIHLILTKVQDVSKDMEGPQQAVQTGNLVYRYNIPSDKDNKIRVGSDSSNYLRDVRSDIYRSEESEETARLRIRREIQDDEGTYTTRQRINKAGSSSSSESQEDLEAPQHHFQPKPNMQQAPEVPLHPFTIGNKGRSIQHDSQVNVEGEARKLAQEIAADLQVQDEIPKRDTLEKFDILTDIVRVMNLNQIQSVAQQFHLGSRQQSENLAETLARKTFRDAVAQAGTGPAVNAISKWIMDRKIVGDEAAEILTAVVKNVRTPTEELIKTLFNLVKSEEIKKQKELYPTALIVFTDLIRRAQVDKDSGYNYYPVHSFGAFYKELEQIVTKEVIPYLAQRLQESVQQKNAQRVLLYIRALGNTGHPDIVGHYEQYIEGQQQLSPFERTAMVISMDRLAKIYPRIARRVLYKIYANIAETPETRSAAVHVLMSTKPSAAMLQRMAEYTHDDPSEAVQAMVKSAIESAAELTDNEWEELAKHAEAAKKFLNQREYGRQYSKTYLRDYVSENLKLVYRQQLSHIVGRDHTFPQSILYNVYKNYGGYEAKNVEVHAMISSIDELLRMIPSGDHASWQNEREQSEAGGDHWSTNRIEKMLNIERDEAEELEGQILFNVMGHKRFYSFDEKTLKELPQALMAAGSVFANGEKLTLNKLYNRRQVVVAFPLATGYPFYYTFSLPTLVQAVGEIQGKTTPDVMQSPSWDTLRKVESVNITGKVHLVFSSEQIAKTGFVTPFERQRYVAGHVRKIQGHVPLNLKIDIDINNRQITGKMAPLDTNKNFEAFHASAWPFTARKDAYSIHPVSQAKDIKMIQTRKAEKYERTIGEKSTGMVFRANMEHQFQQADYFNMERTLQTQGVLALTSLPYSYHSTMQRILDRRVFSSLSFLPYSFEPTAYGPSEKQILMMLAALPFGDDLTTPEIVKAHGILSLIGLPFADVDTLERTTKHQAILGVGMFPWPMKTLDQYKFVVRYDAQRSENQIMKFSLSLRRAYNTDKESGAASNRMNGPASVDDHKLAHTSDVTPNSEDRQRQFLENAAFGINQAYSVALDASLVFDGKSPAQYIATIGHAGSLADEKKRVLAFFSAKPVKKTTHKQMCLTYTGKFPHAPLLSFDDAIKHNHKANAKLQVAFGENCKSSATQINMKMALEQTSEYKQYVEKSESANRCQYEMKQGDYLMPGCLEAAYRANVFDQIAISGEIQNPNPEINNITHRAIALLRHIGFWNLEENINERGQPNKMEATIRVSPTLRHLDAHIRTGSMTQQFNRLHIAPALKSFLNVHQQLDVQDRNMNQFFQNGHVCVVDTNKIFTFDDAIIKPQIGQCWYSLLQHVEPKSNIAKEEKWTPKDVSILVRAASQQANKKEVMIVVAQKSGQDHMIHLKPTGSSIQVNINGQEKKLSKDKAIDVFDKKGSNEQYREGQQPAVRILEIPGQEVQVEVRGKLIQLIFNGSRVKVLAYPLYRNHVRGLCGNFNGEQVDDLITPKNCIMKNEKFFAATWALHEQACSNEVKQMKTKAEQAHCVPIEYEGGNVISSWEAGRHGTERRWSSEASSSSSSSEEDHYNQQNKQQRSRGQQSERSERKCNLRNQVQFVELNGRTCFSIESLPACPSHCRGEGTEQTEVKVHCRDSNDSVSQLYKQQILKGVNPDLSTKKVNNSVTFNIPRKCVTVY